MGMPCPGYGAPSTTMMQHCLPTEVECPGHLLPDATFGPSTCVPMGMPCPGYGAPSTTMMQHCLPTEVECPGHLLPDATFGPSTCVPMGMPCPGYGAPSVCNGQIDCGGKGPCAPGSFCNFDGTVGGNPSDSFCQPCDTCHGNTGLPVAGQVDCAACCTDTKTCTDTRTCFDTSTCCVTHAAPTPGTPA